MLCIYMCWVHICHISAYIHILHILHILHMTAYWLWQHSVIPMQLPPDATAAPGLSAPAPAPALLGAGTGQSCLCTAGDSRNELLTQMQLHNHLCPSSARSAHFSHLCIPSRYHRNPLRACDISVQEFVVWSITSLVPPCDSLEGIPMLFNPVKTAFSRYPATAGLKLLSSAPEKTRPRTRTPTHP